MFEKLPQFLKDRYLFCRWKYEQRDNGVTKVPYQVNGHRMRAGYRAYYTDFANASADLTGFDGISVGVFDDLVAIDIDDCITDGILSDMAEDIVSVMDAYTEISPSGNGIRILCRAQDFDYDTSRYYINNQARHLEVYVGGVTAKSVTVTGNCIRERGLEDRGDQLKLILEKYMLRPKAERQSESQQLPGSCLPDDEVIRKAMASKQGDRFRRLWTGDISGYPSQSEADLAFVSMLAFWCGGDRDQIDRLFRQSGLIREKWDREDYREGTIKRALSGIREFYSPVPVSSAHADFAPILPVLGEMDLIHSRMFSADDIGFGRLFAEVFKDKARFVPERKKWFVYDGTRWAADIAGLMVTELGKTLADELLLYAAGIHDDRERETVLKWCGKWVQRRYRDIYIREAQSVYPLPVSELDGDPYLFNCSNCTIDLRTGVSHEHRPEDLITKISPVDYSPDVRCGRWNTFVDEIMSGDREKAGFMQRALAYGLTGDTRYECMFILYGETTRNGKGTLMESVLKVMGDYGITVRSETIAQKRQNNSHAPSEDVARLAGVRFANISEPSRGLVLDAAQVKDMTGNDTLNARYLNENSFDFSPQFKLYINTNYLPVISDMTLFTSGRIVIIPFDRHFDESEQDRTLKTAFAKPEAQSAILNWLLEGYALLRQHELIQPQSVIDATAEYYHESDKIGQFISERLIKDSDAEERTSAVYEAFRQWCSLNGCYPENSRNFNTELRKIAVIRKKRPRIGGEKTTILIGYRLRSDFLTE